VTWGRPYPLLSGTSIQIFYLRPFYDVVVPDSDPPTSTSLKDSPLMGGEIEMGEILKNTIRDVKPESQRPSSAFLTT
jgi:hypothetical protein